MRRAKTLTRPERGVAPPPLIAPQASLLTSAAVAAAQDVSPAPSPWVIFSWLITFWAPGPILRSVGMKDKQIQQAWREKIALCFLILCLCGAVGFATVGLQSVFCPQQQTADTSKFLELGAVPGTLAVQGFLFNITQSNPTPSVNFYTLASSFPGQDITYDFTRSASDFPACSGLSYKVATDPPCSSSLTCPLGNLNASSTYSTLGLVNMTVPVGYDWDQVGKIKQYIVIDGNVLNMQPYFVLHQTAVANDVVDTALRTVLSQTAAGGRDATRLFSNSAQLKATIPCLRQRYLAGRISKITPGCFVSGLVLYAGLIVILGLVFLRFVMAIVFSWFMSGRLAGSPDSKALNRQAISPAVMPEGANISVDNRLGTAPWVGGQGSKKLQKANGGARGSPMRDPSASSLTLASNSASTAAPIMNLARIGAELFTVCLVTCYSEGEESLRTTLDSISTTTFSDERKLLFIVADGMITGAGEKRSTPDTCVSLLEADPRFGDPVPMSYVAVGTGGKAENRAMVYAGHYSALLPLFLIWIMLSVGRRADLAVFFLLFVFQRSLGAGRRRSSSSNAARSARRRPRRSRATVASATRSSSL
jgi:chitin synthase